MEHTSKRAREDRTNDHSVPVACTLSPSELQGRKDTLLPGLLRRADAIEALPDGRRYRFAEGSDTLQAIARVIDSERQCCRFFRFRLTVEPDGGPFWLEVTGPAGVRELLADLDAL